MFSILQENFVDLVGGWEEGIEVDSSENDLKVHFCGKFHADNASLLENAISEGRLFLSLCFLSNDAVHYQGTRFQFPFKNITRHNRSEANIMSSLITHQVRGCCDAREKKGKANR